MVMDTMTYGGGAAIVNDAPQPDTWHEIVPSPVSVTNGLVPAEWLDMLNELLFIHAARLRRNRIRYRYYDGKNKLKDFGISTPPQLLNVETVVGWPKKAVDALAERSRFDGFAASEVEVQEALDAISERSRLKVKYRQALQSELIHSCCFAVPRRLADGTCRIDFYDAEHAAAVWDDAQGKVAYGLTIEDAENGEPTRVDLITADFVAHIDLGTDDGWQVEPHSLGETPMVAFAYKPTMRKPFGTSRISRSVMSLTDSAVRVALGGDISYQFAVSPQKYLLNADKNPFEERTRWETYIGSIFAVSNDADNGTPVFGQLTQASMQQTVDYMRLLASRFAAETNIPLQQLGVAADSNPTSAEALYAASEPLIIEAEDLNDGARISLKQLAIMALAIEADVPTASLPPEFRDFSPSMRNPAMPSIVSQADAMVKVAAVVPQFAGTDTFFEQLGFSEDIRRRIRSDMAKAQGQMVLDRIFGQGDE